VKTEDKKPEPATAAHNNEIEAEKLKRDFQAKEDAEKKQILQRKKELLTQMQEYDTKIKSAKDNTQKYEKEVVTL